VNDKGHSFCTEACSVEYERITKANNAKVGLILFKRPPRVLE
jgi:hypothetical protein